MQEFLASYAVQVDEDGARRLQSILDQNRTSAGELAAAFSAADSALSALKRNLSDTSGMRNILSALFSGIAAINQECFRIQMISRRTFQFLNLIHS